MDLDAQIQNKLANKVVATEFYENLKNRKKLVSEFNIDL